MAEQVTASINREVPDREVPDREVPYDVSDVARGTLRKKTHWEYDRGYINKYRRDEYLSVIVTDPNFLTFYKRGEEMGAPGWIREAGINLTNDSEEFIRACQHYAKIARLPEPQRDLLSHVLSNKLDLSNELKEGNHFSMMMAGYASVAHEIVKQHIPTLDGWSSNPKCYHQILGMVGGSEDRFLQSLTEQVKTAIASIERRSYGTF
jgi:hypothetical protein